MYWVIGRDSPENETSFSASWSITTGSFGLSLSVESNFRLQRIDCSNYRLLDLVMCRRCGLGLLPLLLAVLSVATFVITYVISFVRKDTSWFPTISDTADRRPESNVFGFLFNFCSVVGLVTAFVRYLQLRHDADWNERDRFVLIRLNKVGLAFGIVSSLGASIVANFQVSKECYI